MSESILGYDLRDGVAVLTMDDGKANALSDTMIAELMAALARAESEASAVVLTGRPDKFCAGFDLRAMMAGPESAVALLRKGSALLMRLFTFPRPLVIAGTGHALAGGALVVLTGDVRYSADGAYKIGLNEVAIGLPVPVLAMELARARILPTELTNATLLAQIYGPAEAARVGYIDRVVAAGELLATAVAEAARLGKLSRPAFLGTKQRLRRATVELIETSLESDLAGAMAR